MKKYLFEYRYGGDLYVYEIPAETLAEAEAPRRAMQWSKYVGELHARVPASLGWLAKAWCCVANFFGRKP